MTVMTEIEHVRISVTVHRTGKNSFTLKVKGEDKDGWVRTIKTTPHYDSIHLDVGDKLNVDVGDGIVDRLFLDE